jgi:hypothetical protein
VNSRRRKRENREPVISWSRKKKKLHLEGEWWILL